MPETVLLPINVPIASVGVVESPISPESAAPTDVPQSKAVAEPVEVAHLPEPPLPIAPALVSLEALPPLLCEGCGTRLETDDRLCPTCGRRRPSAQVEPPAAPAVAPAHAAAVLSPEPVESEQPVAAEQVDEPSDREHTSTDQTLEKVDRAIARGDVNLAEKLLSSIDEPDDVVDQPEAEPPVPIAAALLHVEAAPPALFCEGCVTRLEADDRFCPTCGRARPAVKAESPAAPFPPPGLVGTAVPADLPIVVQNQPPRKGNKAWWGALGSVLVLGVIAGPRLISALQNTSFPAPVPTLAIVSAPTAVPTRPILPTAVATAVPGTALERQAKARAPDNWRVVGSGPVTGKVGVSATGQPVTDQLGTFTVTNVSNTLARL